MHKFSVIWISLPLLALGSHTMSSPETRVSSAPAVDAATTPSSHAAPAAAESWIVQDRQKSMEELKSSIQAVGGQITHKLSVIHAVTAELNAAQIAALRETAPTLRVYSNRSVSSSSTLPTLSDDFDGFEGYAGDDGNQPWAGPWIEDDNDDPHSGDISITHNPAGNKCTDGSSCLQIRTSHATASIYRRLDLSGSVAATLTYDFTSRLRAENEAHLEISDDGGASYHLLRVFDADGSRSGHHCIDISDFLSAQTQLRIRVESHQGHQRIWFDNIQVHYTAQAMPGSNQYPAQTQADVLHQQGLTGAGVTVAMIDTGLWSFPSLNLDTQGQRKVIARYNAITDEDGEAADLSGHGSHIASLIGSSEPADTPGTYNGVAPNASLVAVKAFTAMGEGSYADVIRGIDWLIEHKSELGVRVLNLSFSAEPLSYYWDDPLNQAVMQAWAEGIVVISSAGNTGPTPMSIGVPGNVPYVITVGAMSDNQTADPTDDYLSDFSATGPTLEAFVKPEVVAPGHRILGVMPPDSYLPNLRPELADGAFFSGSGTSQAAAITTGVAALLLEAAPWLTPDELKCRLMAGAQAAVDAQGDLAYNPLQQGAGLVNAVGSLNSNELTCANVGLDIQLDIAGVEHYGGPVRWDAEEDSFYVEGLGYNWDGLLESGGYAWTGLNPWVDVNPWLDVDINPWINLNPWIDVNPWLDVDVNPWIGSSWWSDGIPWESQPHQWDSLTETVTIGLVLSD